GDADRDHADPGSGQLRGAGGGDDPGQYRDHLLCAGGVLWLGGYPAGAARGGVCVARGIGRCGGGDYRLLLVLWLRLRSLSQASQLPQLDRSVSGQW
ncbi:hypothetical protein NYY89_19855, partial [Acinetobacter baumannii]|nr:hypothetical protein [Acinetobacter baumannii]